MSSQNKFPAFSTSKLLNMFVFSVVSSGQVHAVQPLTRDVIMYGFPYSVDY